MKEFIKGLNYDKSLPKVPKSQQVGLSCLSCEGAGQIAHSGKWHTFSGVIIDDSSCYFRCPVCFGEGVMPDNLRHLPEKYWEMVG